MRTRDGVRLDADIYRPEGDGPWPVLLLRQAYGRKVASTVTYAHPRWYAAQGYVVVVQDVRGRGSSEGVFATLEHEAEDGADTIAWCSTLPGTTGAVGMYGFSYQGMNQLLAAAEAGPELKAIAPAMIGWNLRDEMVLEGGAPLLAGAVGWAAQVGADTARHESDGTAYEALRAAAGNLPLGDAVTARPEVLSRFADYHHYFRWLDAGPDDELWRRIAPAARLETLKRRKLPMLFVGGWYDFTLPGTLAGWAAMHHAQPDLTHLVVGPWAHLPWGRFVGDRDFGPQAVSAIDLLQIAWFNHWLKGVPLELSPLRLFDLGNCSWEERAAFPDATLTFYLVGDGRVSADPEAGHLIDNPPEDGEDVLVHDPWRPAPTRGGRQGNPSGPVNRCDVDQRGDVLTFTTAVLDKPLSICGAINAMIHAGADTGSFDLHCTLSRVMPDGIVQPFAEGIRRVTCHGAVDIDLKVSRITLKAGERLRLSIAGASHPAFAINPGEGDPIDTPHIEARIITISVRYGHGHPSAISFGVADICEEPH